MRSSLSSFLILCLASCGGELGSPALDEEDTGEVDADAGGAADGGSGDSGEGGSGDGGGETSGEAGGGSGSGSDGGSGEDSGGDAGGDEGGEDPLGDLREAGPFGVSRTSTSVAVASCTMDVVLYEPDGEGAVLLVLSHGFSRAAANMLGLGEHLASWGLTVAVPSLCHSSILDTDHAQNGEDIVSLAAGLGFTEVIFAGQSAGGLASLLAGAEDAGALGVISLDGVDASGLGSAAAGGLGAPLYGLVGESSSCNSSNNGTAWFSTAADAVAFRVTEADHCDFESDTDELCTWFCTGSNDQFSDAEISATITGLATAAALESAGLEAAAEVWWEAGGEEHDELVASGAIEEL